MTRAIAFMLLGLALENIAKGIIVCRDPKRVSRRGLAKWRGKGHDLVALFEEAQIETTPEERQYLALTTELVEWKARYPVPMALVTPKRELAPAEGYVTQWPPTFFAALVGLYAKAGDAMRSTMEAVAPLPRDHPFSER